MSDETKKVSDNRKKKEQIVAKFADKVGRAKGMVFTNYQGMTHHQLEALKRALKKIEAEYVATKNSLLLIALKDKNIDVEVEKDKFSHMTGTMFIYNELAGPLKELSKTIKTLSLPVIKFGILDGKILTDTDVVKIANLPPLEVLRAQLLGTMISPVSGLHRALNWNITKLVLTMKAISDKKQATS